MTRSLLDAEARAARIQRDLFALGVTECTTIALSVDAVVIGDPSQLYVCSEEALTDRTPWPEATDCDPDGECSDACHRIWRLWTRTTVHGSSSPRVPVSEETQRAIADLTHRLFTGRGPWPNNEERA